MKPEKLNTVWHLLIYTMEESTRKSTPLKTVTQAFDIIEYLKRHGGADISEIAEHFELPKSTVHGYLSTLHDIEYLAKHDGEYYVGLRFLNLGGHAATRKQAYKMARPKVKELAEATEERAQFIVEEFGRGFYIHMDTGNQAVETDVRIGKIASLHTTSAGKAILACLPESRVQAIIQKHGLPICTPNTITDQDTLFEELETIRNRGYAQNDGERITGTRAVGVPVKGPESHVIGAFSVSGPAHRLKGSWYEEEIPDLLLGTANELELNLAYE